MLNGFFFHGIVDKGKKMHMPLLEYNTLSSLWLLSAFDIVNWDRRTLQRM